MRAQPPPAPERSGRTAPGDRIRIPAAPPLGLPTPSPPAWAGEQPERSGLACPPPPSHPPRPEAPPPPSHPDAHGGARRRGATTAGTAASSPELAAQPRRRPRPGLRGAEPRRGREDGGREAGAQRSPAPPPPPAAGENCACRLGEARAPLPVARARASLPALPSPGSRRPLQCPDPLSSSPPAWRAPRVPPRRLRHPRLAPRRPAPTPARVLSRLGYPAQRGLRASRSGVSLPGSERRRPPPLGRAQPQLPPAAAAAPPPGLPGRMEIGAAATRSNPSPPKSAEPGLTYRACEWERGPGAPRGAAGRRAPPQLRRSRRRGSESPDKARDGEAERRLMASPTRRAPPAPLRPPARPPRRSAAPLRALARQSRLGAAASRATPASPAAAGSREGSLAPGPRRLSRPGAAFA
ncbi:basic proline-rich protein-like [Neofelis nebulosa]|uniref:basic proline-rich protein-like n=1 Tax=Neofelis nebulosa TaxID=61452 RepID=UPI002729697E|nr:basic proline-rich protein-like [Neofelis nebulosa]